MTNTMKQQILDEIRDHSTVFRKVNNIQYRIRCPICGDSQTDPRDSHCYIKCDFNNPSEPLLFNCFKCNKGGKVTSKFLKLLGIKSEVVDTIDNQRFNRIGSIKHKDINLITGTPVMDSPQVRYIESRLGVKFTFEDFDKFKIVWDMNTVYPYASSARIRNMMPSNHDSVSFMSDDKSVLLTRAFDDEDLRWRKLTLFNSDNKSFYTIKVLLNLFTQDPLVVNIAEGVLDVLSIYKHFNDGENSAFIATLGSDYISGIEYAISKGFIGKNIVIKIYIDADVNEYSLRAQLKKYKWLFNSIYIYTNIKSKDVGVPIEKIKLVEQKV